MKESKYYPEDKRQEDGTCPELPYTLFADADYTDKDYHKEFPTIYHLRKYLMETMEIGGNSSYVSVSEWRSKSEVD